MQSSAPALPLSQLALCLLPVLFVVWLMQRQAGRGKETLIASGRMLLQLSLVGYVLVYLFALDNAWPVLAVLSFMLLMAGWISLRPLGKKRGAHLKYALWALLGGPGLLLIFVTQFVLPLHTWYEARFVIPLAGMILASSLNGLSVAAERYEREKSQGTKSINASPQAMRAGMIGITNSFLAVGLVTFPGMMTGQILAGVSPLLASRYQMMVMCVLFSGTGIAISIYLWAVRRADASESTTSIN